MKFIIEYDKQPYCLFNLKDLNFCEKPRMKKLLELLMKRFLSKNHIFTLFLILIVQVSIADDKGNNSDIANVFTLGESRLGEARLGESNELVPILSKMLLSALSEAVREGNIVVLQSLLNTGIDIVDIELNEMKQTPLIMAAMYEQRDVVDLLLEAGAT